MRLVSKCSTSIACSQRIASANPPTAAHSLGAPTSVVWSCRIFFPREPNQACYDSASALDRALALGDVRIGSRTSARV